MLRILTSLLMAGLCVFIYQAIVGISVGEHAGCSNGPDGAAELMNGYYSLLLAVVLAIIAAILTLVSHRRRAGSTLWRRATIILFLSMFVPLALTYWGVQLFTKVFRCHLCAVGPAYLKGPSCFRGWCASYSCNREEGEALLYPELANVIRVQSFYNGLAAVLPQQDLAIYLRYGDTKCQAGTSLCADRKRSDEEVAEVIHSLCENLFLKDNGDGTFMLTEKARSLYLKACDGKVPQLEMISEEQCKNLR